MRAFLYSHRRTVRFLGLQKVGVAPDSVLEVLPGRQRVAAGRHAANDKAAMLIGGSISEAIRKLAEFLLRNCYHRGIGYRILVIHIFFLFNDHPLDRASTGAYQKLKRGRSACRESGCDVSSAQRHRFKEEALAVTS